MVILLEMRVEIILGDPGLFMQCVSCFTAAIKLLVVPVRVHSQMKARHRTTNILNATFFALKKVHNTSTFAIQVFGSNLKSSPCGSTGK